MQHLVVVSTSLAVVLFLATSVNLSLLAEGTSGREDFMAGSLPVLTSPGPGYEDTSEFLIGTVAVGVFLVESAGSEFDWTNSEISEAVDAVKTALDWWASQEPKARVSFTIEWYARAMVTVEPIRQSVYDDGFWIHEILQRLDYAESGPLFQARHFDNDLRDRHGTDWAFSMFIVKGSDGSFANGKYGHAHYGGPWFTVAYASARADAASLLTRYVAHETGHIFYATDEYNGAIENSGYLNCPDSEGADAIMGRNVTLQVSEGTRCQVGWADGDGNGILDVLDAPPETTIVRVASLGPDCQLWYEGTATVATRPNQNSHGGRNSVTVSRITNVEYRIDGGDWTPSRPDDGAFDGFTEHFRIATTLLASGSHGLEVRSRNTEGIMDSVPTSDSETTSAAFCSAVDPLPSILDRRSVTATASTRGDVSAVELWYSFEGRPPRLFGQTIQPPWRWVFDATEAGGEGNYTFFSVARDERGNREYAPPQFDANTRVVWENPESGNPMVIGALAIAASALIGAVSLALLRFRRRRHPSS